MATRFTFILIAIISFNSFCFSQEKPTELQKKLQEKLNTFQESGLAPGISAAVVLRDGTLIAIASGLSDREKKSPMTTEHVLLQGSVGKTYVAAVAMQLIHEKKLALTDKISKYLGDEPWFSKLPNSAYITVKMLMNHTSGLVRYEFQEKFIEDLMKLRDKDWKPAEQISYIFGTKAPFEAGKGWQYSDTNYIVLGMIIEKITGQPYYSEASKRLWEPLGLKKTYASSEKIPGLSQGYAGSQNPFGNRDAMLDDKGMMPFNPKFEWTGGGVASTTSDLVRWGKLLYEGKAFDKSMLPVMLDAVDAPGLGRNNKYGLGVIIRETSLGKSYGHSGFFPGYLTELAYWPDHQIAIAVQVNTSGNSRLRPPVSRWTTDLASTIVPPAKK